MDFDLDPNILSSRNTIPIVNTKEQWIIWKFCQTDKLNWPNNIKIAKELWTKYPEYEFWDEIQTPMVLFNMIWFKTEQGKKFIDSRYEEFKNKPVIHQIEEKQGQDEKVEKKQIRTLAEFLDNDF